MGLDLTLTPDSYGCGFSTKWFLAHTRIDLQRNYSLFAAIGGRRGEETQVCYPRKLPESVKYQWYGDEGIETRTTDPYGDPLTYVTAGELRKAFEG